MDSKELKLIPQPQKVTFMENECHFPSISKIFLQINEQNERIISKCTSLFERTEQKQDFSGDGFAIYTNAEEALVWLDNFDSYRLKITEQGITLTAKTARGFFYGLTTLDTLNQNYKGNLPCCLIEDWADLEMRTEYLDFRVTFPKFELLLKYIEELATYKVNTLFIEYEDKLPFRKLGFLAHKEHAFTQEQHERLLKTARENFIAVIPKQQCFGHLEYILKHDCYINLRETYTDIAELCPSKPESLAMMTSILEEVINLHKESEYIHIGCDEVWSLKTCSICKGSEKNAVELYIEFVNKLIGFVCSHKKTPMIWHDMLANATSEEIECLDKRAIVCVWTYSGAYAKPEAERIIQLLQEHSITVLGAPSVRCWDGDGEQNYPNLQNRVRNLLEWTDLAKKYSLKGVVNTNWAVPFALGSPYGIFETTRFPTFFSLEHSWNYKADVDSYLSRFLLQYHGIEEVEGYNVVDYFEIAPSVVKLAKKNVVILQWIQAVMKYELYYKRKFPVQTYMARHDEEHFALEIKISLIEKATVAKRELAKVKVIMTKLLEEFMSADMVSFYIKTRFYLFELYMKELESLYKKKGE